MTVMIFQESVDTSAIQNKRKTNKKATG